MSRAIRPLALSVFLAAACSPTEQVEATSAAEVRALAARGHPVRVLVLYGPLIDDAALAEAPGVRGVEELVIEGGRASATGLAELCRIPGLRSLGFKDAEVTGFAALASAPSLKSLALHALHLAPAELPVEIDGLLRLKRLEFLMLGEIPELGASEVGALQNGLPQATIRWLERPTR